MKKLVDKKNDRVKLDIIPKTNEDYISVTYGCVRIIDCYRFLWSSLEQLVKTMHDDDFGVLNKEFQEKLEKLNKKVGYANEYFNSIGFYQKPVNKLKKAGLFSKLKNICLDDKEIEQTKEINKLSN